MAGMLPNAKDLIKNFETGDTVHAATETHKERVPRRPGNIKSLTKSYESTEKPPDGVVVAKAALKARTPSTGDGAATTVITQDKSIKEKTAGAASQATVSKSQQQSSSSPKPEKIAENMSAAAGSTDSKRPGRRNVLIVFCHWEHKSYNGALLEVAKRTLEREGHSVVVSDLYEMNFNPVLSQKDIKGGL